MDSTEDPLTTVKSTGQVTAKVAEDGAEKQDQNGSGTVSTEPDVDPAVRRRAAEVLADVVLNDWPERDQRPMVLLRALCEIEAEGRGTSSVGWDGIEVARAMARLGDGRAHSREREATAHKKEGWEGKVKDIKQDTYTEIRKLWKDLEKIWKRKCAADSILVRRAREQGMAVYAVPTKKKGGGAHNPNRYRLALSPLPPETIDSDVSSDNQEQSAPPAERTGSIKYSTDTVSIPTWLQWLPTDGLRTRSPIGAFLVALFSFSWATLTVASLFTALLLMVAATTLAFLQFVAGAGWLAAFSYLLLGWFPRLIEDGVTRAPFFWQPLNKFGNNVLEIRRDPAGKESPRIHLVRYVADCPVCGPHDGRSAVRIESGRLEFFGRRIVGRCIHAPNAHVFSFDHITKRGRPLR
jgi:hypothetical protein